MPPPTSPNQPPARHLALPGFFEGHNSRLRHLVSHDFLTRMNEVLANLLNQHTGTHEPQDPDTDMHISTTLLPAQIRNLASPIRFLAIPDLDLDMDLDATDTDSRSFVDDTSSSSLDSDSDVEFHLENENVSDSDASSSENDSDVPPHGLLDRIQLAQRLLLSSARQNHTNRNTLIITPETRPSGAVSLTRQNAIRSKSRQDHNSQALGGLAKEYHHEFLGAMSAIRSLPSYLGKSPLFSNHPHSEQRRGLRRWGCRRLKKPSLQAHMDRFLHLRKKGKLWPESEHLCRTNPIHEHHSESTKRKPDAESPNRKKRRKIKEESRKQVPISASSSGETIDASLLVRSDKLRILSGLRCSYLKNGSTFSLGLVSDWLFKRGSDMIDLTFSQVDHSEKSVHGHFSLKFGGDRTGDVHLILSFLAFLCGGPRSGYCINCTNKVIQTKSALLNEAFMAVIVEHGLSNPEVVQCLTKAYLIPFHGDLIDFDKNDLRFLPETRSVAPKPGFSRAIHASRVRNEQIKFQLGEWLRIRPFHNFSEAFFLNYLFFVEKYLREFDQAPKHEQELSVEFAKHLKELIFHITKDFAFLDEAEIPMLDEKLQQAKKDLWERKRHEPRSNLQKSSFLQEWDTKLSEKLCDYVTCEDSCLLNIQLNYVLFTVKVDVSSTLDQVFYEFLDLVSKDSERYTLQKKYDALCKETLLPEARETVFVCSLNRKTGRLEMQNTRLYLDYKYAGSCDARTSATRLSFPTTLDASFSDSDEENVGPLRRRYSLSSGNSKYLEDPYLMGNPTVIAGVWKRNSPGSCTGTGGNAKYNFV